MPSNPVGMILGAASSVLNVFQKIDAQKAESAQWDENVRRQNAQFREWSAGVKAAAAASGIRQDSDGLGSYLEAITSEFRRQQEFAGGQLAAAQQSQNLAMGLGFVTDMGSMLMGNLNADFKADTSAAKSGLNGTGQSSILDLIRYGGG